MNTTVTTTPVITNVTSTLPFGSREYFDKVYGLTDSMEYFYYFYSVAERKVLNKNLTESEVREQVSTLMAEAENIATAGELYDNIVVPYKNDNYCIIEKVLVSQDMDEYRVISRVAVNPDLLGQYNGIYLDYHHILAKGYIPRAFGGHLSPVACYVQGKVYE